MDNRATALDTADRDFVQHRGPAETGRRRRTKLGLAIRLSVMVLLLLVVFGGFVVFNYVRQQKTAAIFAGMGDFLRCRKLRDIVYEENAGYPAASHDELRSAGYTLFAFREQLTGPEMIPAASNAGVKRPYDIPPSYLATSDPERAKRLLSHKGWDSLRSP